MNERTWRMTVCKHKVPLCMLFGDDIALINDTRDEVNVKLE